MRSRSRCRSSNSSSESGLGSASFDYKTGIHEIRNYHAERPAPETDLILGSGSAPFIDDLLDFEVVGTVEVHEVGERMMGGEDQTAATP